MSDRFNKWAHIQPDQFRVMAALGVIPDFRDDLIQCPLLADSVEKLFFGGAEKILGLYGACVGHGYGGLRKLLSNLTKITHTNLCMPIEQDSPIGMVFGRNPEHRKFEFFNRIGRLLPFKRAFIENLSAPGELDFGGMPVRNASGLPLNPQLTERDARRVSTTQTAPKYRFYALPDGKRPGLIKVENDGAAIACEVWEMPASQFGSFVADIPAPLGIGKLELADGSTVNGFICEGIGMTDAQDITEYGGWRAWLATRDK